MAHPEQLHFVEAVRNHISCGLGGIKILEIGSFDVNGSVRTFFRECDYLGVDLTEGPGVDLICDGHKLEIADATFDLTLSCECFEHNPHWVETLLNMYRMTKCGGLVVFTCATTGRVEHGTTRTAPKESPGTQSVGWDYYRNLTKSDVLTAIDVNQLFEKHIFMTNNVSKDLYFVGLKPGADPIFSFDVIAFEKQYQEALRLRNIEHPTSLNQRITYWPLRLIEVLPDTKYQNFAVPYMNFVSMLKASLKRLCRYLGRG